MESNVRKKLMDAVNSTIPINVSKINEEMLNKLSDDIFVISKNFKIRNDFDNFCNNNKSDLLVNHNRLFQSLSLSIAKEDCAYSRLRILDFIIKATSPNIDNEYLKNDIIFEYVYNELRNLFNISEKEAGFNSFINDILFVSYAYFGLEFDANSLILNIKDFETSFCNAENNEEKNELIRAFAKFITEDILSKSSELVDDKLDGEKSTDEVVSLPIVNENNIGLTNNSLNEKILIIKNKLAQLEELSAKKNDLMKTLTKIQSDKENIIKEINSFKL